MRMKSREVIAALIAAGWVEVRAKGSHRQFKHPRELGLVTGATAWRAGHQGWNARVHRAAERP